LQPDQFQDTWLSNLINCCKIEMNYSGRNFMARKKKKQTGSPSTIQKSSNQRTQPSILSIEEFSHMLESALKSEDANHALEVLDSAPGWMKKKPNIMFIRANILDTIGEEWMAINLFQEIERKHPHFMPVYYSLAACYMDRDWPGHALQAARRAFTNPDLVEEIVDTLQGISDEATAFVQSHAIQFGLSFKMMERACIFHEQALMAMEEGKHSEAEHFAAEAIKIAPNWAPPHNNHAQALFYSGRVAEAIAVCRDAGRPTSGLYSG
jgi:tetratricopeptide (TPR) repeat protein